MSLSSNTWLDKFASKSDIELARVVCNSDDYEAEAVAAAKELLDSRGLNESQLLAIHTEATLESAPSIPELSIQPSIEHWVGKSQRFLLSFSNVKTWKADQYIWLVFLYYAFASIQGLISYFEILHFSVTEDSWQHRFEKTILELAGLTLAAFLQTAGTILLILRKRAGWWIVGISSFSVCILALNAAYRSTVSFLSRDPLDEQLIALFEISIESILYRLILTLVFHLPILLVLLRRDVRLAFGVSDRPLLSSAFRQSILISPLIWAVPLVLLLAWLVYVLVLT
jgi:hypothetical protein